MSTFSQNQFGGGTFMRVVLVALLLFFPLFQSNNAWAQGNAQAGKALWENAGASRCSYCHGQKGEGGFGPDLAGRQLSLEQFKQAVRKPWGVMPAYLESQASDQDLANYHAYFASLPRVAQPGPWRTPLPANAPYGQVLLVATVGCGQCHGAVIQGPRADAGALGADFEWFKRLVYDHAASMPDFRKSLGQADTPVRMGNYSRARLPEPLLEQIWRYMSEDLKLRVPVTSNLSTGSSAGAYNLVVQNDGVAGKGLAAEDITITLVLRPGTKVTNATGAGYQGVRTDAQAKADVAVWQLPRLGPKEQQSYTLTVASGGGVASGQVRWNRPAQGGGNPDEVAVAMPPQNR
jgi:mono/diheme cytochrome c family protein